MLDKLFGKVAKVKARVVCWNQTPCLIASFNTSEPPIVWQMDLEKLTSYTLKLVEKEGEWDLGYTVPKGDFTSVAHFEIRPEAEAAYEAVRHALMTSTCAATRGPVFIANGSHWLRNILLIVVVGFLALLVMKGIVGGLSSLFSPGAPVQTSLEQGAVVVDKIPADAVPVNTEKELPSGVPLNADDVLPKDVQ